MKKDCKKLWDYTQFENEQISLGKCAFLIICLFVMAFVKTVVIGLQLKRDTSCFSIAMVILHISLLTIFLIYLLGDIANILAGKTKHIKGKLVFEGLSKTKQYLCKLGDTLRIILFIVTAVVSVVQLFETRDMNIILSISISWGLWATVGFVARRWVKKTYLSLLVAVMIVRIYDF